MRSGVFIDWHYGLEAGSVHALMVILPKEMKESRNPVSDCGFGLGILKV